ncbi:hypothetical protein F2P81_025351 [Scophthalmus maximus]|uniref:Uncharacterized protein n=1 Tax=Scophthalmus maximus TaxID=52904 RepID=A0A6A4RSR6_SCOMX|nr:hypothetical protein F2P81_025351 [Scophthalmus maximus]
MRNTSDALDVGPRAIALTIEDLCVGRRSGHSHERASPSSNSSLTDGNSLLRSGFQDRGRLGRRFLHVVKSPDAAAGNQIQI